MAKDMDGVLFYNRNYFSNHNANIYDMANQIKTTYKERVKADRIGYALIYAAWIIGSVIYSL